MNQLQVGIPYEQPPIKSVFDEVNSTNPLFQ